MNKSTHLLGFVQYLFDEKDTARKGKTINAEATSRNRHHFEAFARIKELLGDKPLVLDRVFSYLGLMENPVFEKINFVIRLKEAAKYIDQEGKLVAFSI